MMMPKARWLVVCGIGIITFPAVWAFCQVFLHRTPDESSAVAGAVMAIVLLPLAAWAANASLPWVEPNSPTAAPTEPGLAVATPAVEVQHDTDAQHVESYQELLRQRYRHVDMEVLTPASEQDDYPLVPLDEVFVAPEVKADPPSIELPREFILRLLEGDLSPSQELPSGMGRAELQGIRASYEQVPAVDVLSLLADEEAERIILLGDPGSGKSTLAKYVALVLADDVVTGPLAPLAGHLAVLVALREFAQRSNDTFVEFLDHLHRSQDLGLPSATMERYLRRGKALVIFDGLDEIFDPDTRGRTINKIVWFATNFPQARVVVTSRPIDFRRSALEAAGFRRHKLQDLDRRRIGEFVHNWYRMALPADPLHADRLRDRLLESIDASSPVRELTGNPLLLTILAIIGKRQRLPKDRRTVYEHAVTVLIDQWDPHRFLQDRRAEEGIPYLDAADKLEMLRLVARRMQDGPGGLSGNFISGADLTGEFTSFLQQRDATGLTTDQARVAAGVMLRQFRERNFVLSRFGADAYGFVHRSFLEYLAAADIVHRFTSEQTMTEADLVSGVFGTRWREPAWHEVLVLASGMLDHKFASKAITHLLEADPHWAASTAAEGQQIIVAIRCLAESRHIGRQAQACRMAIDKLIHMLKVAHRRTTRIYDDSLSRAIEQTLLPLFQAFGPFWPGRERFLTWYTDGGSADVDDPSTMAVTIKLAIALVGADDGLLAFLRSSAVRSHRPAQRQAAVWAIANAWPDDQAAMQLVSDAATTDPSEEVRQTAMMAMTVARPGDAATQALLRRIARHDPHESLRHAAVQTMTTLWADEPDAASSLREIIETDQHSDVRQAAIQALADRPHTDSATVALLQALAVGDGHEDVRSAALTALQGVQPQHKDFFKARMTVEKSESVRRLLVTLLAETTAGDPQTLDWLSELATSDLPAAVRQTALHVVADGWAGNASARALLLSRAAHDASADVREAAVHEVGVEGFSTRETFDRLQQLAEQDQSDSVRIAAIKVIASYRGQEPATLRWLKERAQRDDRASVRRTAVREVAEGRLEVDDIAVWLSERAVDDQDASVRRQAVHLVANAWHGEPEIRLWLEDRAVGDDSSEVRAAAVQAMADGWPHHPQTLARLSERALADPHESVRRTALQAIVAHWRHDQTVWPLLHRLVTSDPKPLIRRAALRMAADGWPDQRTLRTVFSAVDDQDPAVRAAALLSLVAGWADDQRTVAALRNRAEEDEEGNVRLTAVKELTRRWMSDPATSSLFYHRLENDPHQAVRLALLQSIVAAWRNRPEALPAVRKRAKADPNPAVRCEAVQALADHWPGDPQTGELLAELATHDSDDVVKRVASRAVAKSQAHSPSPMRWRQEGGQDA